MKMREWLIRKEFERLIRRYEYFLKYNPKQLLEERDVHIEKLSTVKADTEELLKTLSETASVCSKTIQVLSNFNKGNNGLKVKIQNFLTIIYAEYVYHKVVKNMEIFENLKERLEKILWRFEIDKGFNK